MKVPVAKLNDANLLARADARPKVARQYYRSLEILVQGICGPP